ncbi:MAG: hypothetical protein Q4E55_05410 [Bacteroidales bacterium]|nr:hypothetical protein [Bacteroidales bacterium]
MGIGSMFKPRKPRGFHHQYIYYDERQARLDKIEERAKRELGMEGAKPFNPESIRGSFVEGTTHLKRRKERGQRLSLGVMLFLIVALLLILHYLMTGNFHF